MILSISDPSAVPEGYAPFFGDLYVQKTTIEGALDKAKESLKPVSFACEMALAAVQAAREALHTALAAVQELYNTVMSTINEALAIPMETINEMMGKLEQMVSGVGDVISGMLPEGGELMGALEQLMKCSAFADSEAGKTVAGAMDELGEAGSLAGETKDKLMGMMAQTAGGAVDEFMSSPLALLADVNSKYEEALAGLQIGRLFDALNKIEDCARGVCTPAELAERLPSNANSFVSSLGAKFDAATGQVSSMVTEGLSGETAAIMNAADKYKALAAKIPGVGR